jgi:hypothetical protein
VALGQRKEDAPALWLHQQSGNQRDGWWLWRQDVVYKISDSNIMTYGGDNWVAYMNEAVRTSRTSLYTGYNMAGTTNWAVDLDEFYDPSTLLEGGGTLGWGQNIKATGNAKACNRELRSGDWVKYESTAEEVTPPLRYVPKDRWEHLEGGNAWNDAKLRWQMCDAPARKGTFSESVAQFFHMTESR